MPRCGSPSRSLGSALRVWPAFAVQPLLLSQGAPPEKVQGQVVPVVPSAPVVVRFGLGSVLAFGVAPRVAAGVTVDAGILWPVEWGPLEGVSLSVGGRWDPPAAGHVPWAGAGVRVSASRLLVTVTPCGHWWKLYGCALGELGQLRHHAEGIALPAGAGNLSAAVGGRVGVELPFAPYLGFRGFGDVLGTLTPVTALIDARPAWTTPRVSGGVGAGLFVYF